MLVGLKFGLKFDHDWHLDVSYLSTVVALNEKLEKNSETILLNERETKKISWQKNSV